MTQVTDEDKKWLRRVFSRAIHVENNGSPLNRKSLAYLINAEEDFFSKLESMNKELNELKEENEKLKEKLFNSKESQNGKEEYESNSEATEQG